MGPHGAGLGPGHRAAADAGGARRLGLRGGRDARTAARPCRGRTTAPCGSGTWPPGRRRSGGAQRRGRRGGRDARTAGTPPSRDRTDRAVRVWDLATGQARTLGGHGYWVNAVAVTPDGRTAVSGSDDTTVRVWDLATGQARTLEGHGGSVTAVAVTRDGGTAVSGSTTPRCGSGT